MGVSSGRLTSGMILYWLEDRMVVKHPVCTSLFYGEAFHMTTYVELSALGDPVAG